MAAVPNWQVSNGRSGTYRIGFRLHQTPAPRACSADLWIHNPRAHVRGREPLEGSEPRCSTSVHKIKSIVWSARGMSVREEQKNTCLEVIRARPPATLISVSINCSTPGRFARRNAKPLSPVPAFRTRRKWCCWCAAFLNKRFRTGPWTILLPSSGHEGISGQSNFCKVLFAVGGSRFSKDPGLFTRCTTPRST